MLKYDVIVAVNDVLIGSFFPLLVIAVWLSIHAKLGISIGAIGRIIAAGMWHDCHHKSRLIPDMKAFL